jgi:magnesium chelatase accessory protein
MFAPTVKPDWNREGRDWPNRAASRFVQAAGLRWHVQIMGEGPVLLLLHGAGAATHSWRDLAPLLARDFRIVAPDLPGHGFTSTPSREDLSLPGMVRALGDLLAALELRPDTAVGHSAGAPLALRLRLDGRIGSGGVVSLNGALLPFPGAAGLVLPAMARLLFLNPLANQMFAWRADTPGAVARLIEGTGSKIDRLGLELYRRLFRTTGHVAGALGMMAHWDLNPLIADLGGLPPPLVLVAAANDRAVPPSVSRRIAMLAPDSTLLVLPSLGHLAHEEAPGRIAEIIRRAVQDRTVIDSSAADSLPRREVIRRAHGAYRNRAAPSPPEQGSA